MKTVMCGTCGYEVDAKTEEDANKQHLKYDGAHEPNWYEDGDINKWLGRTNW